MNHYASCPLSGGYVSIENSCICEGRTYTKLFGIGGTGFIAELWAGYIAKSAGLKGDAWHMLTDMASIAISKTVSSLVAARPDKERKIRSVGAYINAAILFGTACWVFYEGIRKWLNTEEVAGGIVVGVATFGLVLNYIQHEILSGEYRNGAARETISIFWERLKGFEKIFHAGVKNLFSKSRQDGKTITREAQEFHILWDMVGNIVVIASGPFVLFGITIADPIATFIIGGLMVRSTIVLIQKIKTDDATGHNHCDHRH